MRNVFDQYSHHENRLTHALVCSLGEDRGLLRRFVKWATGSPPPASSKIQIVEQRIPGVPEIAEEDKSDGGGLPDGWIYNDDGWSLLIESKVAASLHAGQLRRHLATARRHNFDDVSLLVLTAQKSRTPLRDRITHKQWSDVYEWMRRQYARSEWARRLVEFMQIAESRMIDDEYLAKGNITMFDGFQFDEDRPFTYTEGKRLIKQVMPMLKKRRDLQKIGADPDGEGRSAITGRGGAGVWDFMPLKKARRATSFTSFPHLTLGIHAHDVSTAITVPNGIKGGLKGTLKSEGFGGFAEVIDKIEKRTRSVIRKSKGARAQLYVLQRHYPSQRSVGVKDARLEFDLRTTIRQKNSRVRHQPQWLEAAYDVLVNKRSNIQFGVTTEFSYNCPIIRSKKALDLLAESWIAMSPMLDFVLD